jgi:hypothetical protein
MSPKALLAGLFLVGFLISIPIWLKSNTEDKQHLSQSPVKQLVEKQIGLLDAGLLDIKPAEKAELRKMLAPEPELKSSDFERTVWVKDIIQTIKPWVPNPDEAETIAHWVYINSKRFNLSPELVLGLIAVESRFDHFAVSNVGAVGLMQVMPFWKKELGSASDNLLKIETNTRYGCAILRHYIDRFKTLDRALGAYNGSLGRMKYPNLVYAKMKKFKASENALAVEPSTK